MLEHCALYCLIRQDGERCATTVQEEGEKTVVLKASSGAELEALEAKAQSLLLPTFLVRVLEKITRACCFHPERMCLAFTLGHRDMSVSYMHMLAAG